MKIQQISIFLENKSGRLADVIHTIAKAGLNIRALSLADTNEFGILRLIVDNHEKAKEVLKEAGFTVNITSVVGIEVSDNPGELDRVLQLVEGKNINVEYMYAFASLNANKAMLIIRFDDNDKGVEALQSGGFSFL